MWGEKLSREKYCRGNPSRHFSEKEAKVIALNEKQGLLGPKHHRRSHLFFRIFKENIYKGWYRWYGGKARKFKVKPHQKYHHQMEEQFLLTPDSVCPNVSQCFPDFFLTRAAPLPSSHSATESCPRGNTLGSWSTPETAAFLAATSASWGGDISVRVKELSLDDYMVDRDE